MEILSIPLGEKALYHKVYEGNKFPDICPGNVADHLEKIRNMECRHDDVFIMSYPRSGTHWIREIVAMLMKGKAEYIVNDNIDFPIELLDMHTIVNEPSPRVFYSHMPFRYLPRDHLARNGKVIGCFRNPKDVMTSAFHFFNNISFQVEWETYFNVLLEGNGPYGCWFAWRDQWGRVLDDQTEVPPLTVTYEDTSRNLERQVQKIADYLGVPYTENLITDITHACEFNNMKSAKTQTKSNMMKRIKDAVQDLETSTSEDVNRNRGGHNTIIRKGTVGDWKTLFTKEQKQRFNTVYRNKTLPGIRLDFKGYIEDA
ncbi:sulfotransferase family cytosolic 1B member 1-like [Pecten maximus]|uniref:sulfotransferase family cytosolic 1B member 1-like n=1 Tax=Pecten maximus TaxID=6579 RepID=UPI0014589FCC|nr:sulfotransferase family cytosolic 1B member 1-like [Pecten maximus]